MTRKLKEVKISHHIPGKGVKEVDNITKSIIKVAIFQVDGQMEAITHQKNNIFNQEAVIPYIQPIQDIIKKVIIVGLLNTKIKMMATLIIIIINKINFGQTFHNHGMNSPTTITILQQIDRPGSACTQMKLVLIKIRNNQPTKMRE